MITIGSVQLENKLFLAPMSNVTSMPFRVLCRKYGAGMVYSEMINADAYVVDSFKTGKRSFFKDSERPIGIQLSGSSVEVLRKAAVKVEKELEPDLVDINIGCPAYNVMKSGCGASLLEDPEKLGEIVSELASSLKIPLTCKIRITKSDDETIKIAKIIEDSGAKALTVHGRTAKMKYSGTAHWHVIKKVKDALSIPVILNGDVVDEKSAEKALKETGCDGAMVGRACIGNPHLFKRINHYLEKGEMLKKQTLSQRIRDFFEYLNICEEYDYDSMSMIKLQAHNFTKGFEGGAEIRQGITDCKSVKEIKDLLKTKI